MQRAPNILTAGQQRSLAFAIGLLGAAELLGMTATASVAVARDDADSLTGVFAVLLVWPVMALAVALARRVLDPREDDELHPADWLQAGMDAVFLWLSVQMPLQAVSLHGQGSTIQTAIGASSFLILLVGGVAFARSFPVCYEPTAHRLVARAAATKTAG